jgi:xanthine dehydrogenase YagS FAD-binding subunit
MLFELPYFEHAEATSVHQAVSLLREYGGEAAVIAGATDLLGLLKDKIEGPEMKIPRILLNINNIAEMKRISEYGEEGKIGAAVTLTDLLHNELIREHFPVLHQAMGRVGTTQLRNMGTIGGNLCQRPRCMYFRHPHFLCFKKGGKRCFAAGGEHRDYHAVLHRGRCVMAHPSDTAPALIALNAVCVIADADGEKTMPLKDFFAGADSHRETVLNPDQILKEIRLPRPTPGSRQIFLKQSVRHSVDFALANVAAVAVFADNVCRAINLVLGGVAPLPVVAQASQAVLEGRPWDDGTISEAAEAALAEAKPLPGNRYKIDLAKGLVHRALHVLREAR